MPIPLRSDFDAAQLRGVARRTKDAPQARRLVALAAIYEGATRMQAAAIGGVTLQIVRDWVAKFNAHGPDGLVDRKAPGQPSRLNDTHRAALATMIESGPMPAVHGVVRWRLIDLCQWLFEEFRTYGTCTEYGTRPGKPRWGKTVNPSRVEVGSSRGRLPRNKRQTLDQLGHLRRGIRCQTTRNFWKTPCHLAEARKQPPTAAS